MSAQPDSSGNIVIGLDPAGDTDVTWDFIDEVSEFSGYARHPVRADQMQRTAPCPDCGVVLQPHRDDCLTRAVDEGRMTPRERQIARLDRREDLDLSRIIDETIARTTKPPSLVKVSPGDLSKLLTPREDTTFVETLAGGAMYKGVPVAHLEDGVAHIIPARGGLLSSAGLQAGQPDPGPAVDRAEWMRRLYSEFGIGRASASGVIKNIT